MNNPQPGQCLVASFAVGHSSEGSSPGGVTSSLAHFIPLAGTGCFMAEFTSLLSLPREVGPSRLKASGVGLVLGLNRGLRRTVLRFASELGPVLYLGLGTYVFLCPQGKPCSLVGRCADACDPTSSRSRETSEGSPGSLSLGRGLAGNCPAINCIY